MRLNEINGPDVDRILKLPTPRLLAYYRKLRGAYAENQAGYYPMEDRDEEDLKNLLAQVKAELGTRENV